MIEVYDIRVNVTGGNALRKATSSALGFDRAIDEAGRSTNVLNNRLRRTPNNPFAGATGSLNSLIARVGVATTVMDGLNKSAQLEGMENAITFASAGEGEKNLAFLTESSNALGQSLEANLQGFKLWAGSTKNTVLQGQATRDIFYAVSESATAMNLGAEDAKGVMLALSQVMSKGKVQAEELRGQIGERIPGAFNIAARAMGVTTGQLDKMLERGEVMAADFLPKFATELHNTFGGAIESQSQSATANFNRMRNSIFRLRTSLGAGLMPTVTRLINTALIPMAEWTSRNINTILTAGAVLGGLTVLVKTYSVVTKVATATTALLSGGFSVLNAIMALNPVGLVVTGILALGAATVFAWNKFAGFRGFLTGTWEALKETGRILFNNVAKPFMSLGKILVGVFTLDKKKITEGIMEGLDALRNSDGVFSAAAKIGVKYSEGFQKGVDSKKVNVGIPGFKAPGALSSQFAGAPGAGGGSTTGAPGQGSGVPGSVRSGISAINGGGRNVKNINVNVGKMVEQFVVNTTKLEQGEFEIRALIERVMLQVLNSANQTQ